MRFCYLILADTNTNIPFAYQLLAVGVAINNQMIGVEQLALQYELVNGYFKLKDSFCQITGLPPDFVSETFTREENERLAALIYPPSGSEASSPGEKRDD